MVQRKIAGKLKELIEHRGQYNDVLLVEGPRQVGKTTLVRQTLAELGQPYKEVNLEENKMLSEKIDLCEDFTQFTELVELEIQFHPGGKEILFIDEAQESQRLGSFVRFMKEKWKNTRVILSGSILSRIFRGDTRYPVGRVIHVEVQPFSFEEFLAASRQDFLLEKVKSFPEDREYSSLIHQRLLKLLEDYAELGGMPEVVTAFFGDPGDWRPIREKLLLGYYHDFKRVYGEERQSTFVASLKATAYLLGSPFQNSYVARLLGGGKNQEIVESLGQLEAWKMVLKVEQRGPSVESHYHPKRYLFDSGIAKQLREAAIPSVRLGKTLHAERRIPLGGLIENITANALIPQTMGLSGWKKSSSGSEVDFVVKHQEHVIPVECKAALSVKNTHLGGVRDFMNIYRVPVGVVVALAPFEVRHFSDDRKVVILPIYLVEQLRDILEKL